jgi:DNA-binding GntR family transcriptional regulator
MSLKEALNRLKTEMPQRELGGSSHEAVTKEHYLYRVLRDAIVGGIIPPGTHLHVAELADALGTSPIPVRAALRSLDSDGLVEVKPHVGAFVTELEYETVIDILVVREVLEDFAVTRSVPRLDEAAIAQLSMLCAEMGEAARQDDSRTYARLNAAFHRAIYSECGNPPLIEVLGQLELRSERGQLAFSAIDGRMAESNEEHRLILAAIEAKDVPRVKQMLHVHREGIRRVLAALHEKSRSTEGD